MSQQLRQGHNQVLAYNDLLLEKSGGGAKQLVGAVVQFHRHTLAVCANFIAKMTPRRDFDGRFLTYLHGALYAADVNYRSIKQTTGIQNIDSNQYLSEKVAFPPLDEQRTIAAFLDHETARIDRLIEKQQRLIELLEEKRQAVISHAVTKGLDPDAPMKDSGVEWLGEVPAHWEVVNVSTVTDKITNGYVGPTRDVLVASGVRYLQSLHPESVTVA